MSTFYVDFALGDDAKDGTSWANAWKTFTTGATAARIAPGDLIKVAKSPAPVSIGHATWKAQGYNPPTTYVTSCTNAPPIVVTRANHGYIDGDYVTILGQTVCTAANGTWKIANKTLNTYELEGSVGNGVGGGTGTVYKQTAKAIVLETTGQVKNIDLCELAGWTLANGATVAVYTSSKQGAYSQKIQAPAAPATGTKYAYKTITSTDYSDYQLISFWIYNNAAILGTQWKLCLCDDALGASIQDEFVIPAIPSTTRWLAITIAKTGGGNCYKAVQSIALYSNTVAPANSSYVYLDNIIACKTGGLNLQSLISKNSNDYSASGEGWYAIQSINDPLVLVDNGTQTVNIGGRGYFSTLADDHVETYIRETVKVPIVAASSTSSGTINDSGTLAGGQISFQGGYNTSTDEQDGQTIIDGLNGVGHGISASSKNYITLNRLSAVRLYTGLYYSTGVGVVLDVLPNFCCNENINININALTAFTLNTIVACNNSASIGFQEANTTPNIGTIGQANNNVGYNASFSAAAGYPKTIAEITEACNGGTVSIYIAGSLQTITTIGRADRNASHGIQGNGSNYFRIGTIGSACYNLSNGLTLDGYCSEVGTITALNYNVTGLGLNNGPNRISRIVALTGNTSIGIQFNGSGAAEKPPQTIGEVTSTGNTKLFSLPSGHFDVAVNNLTYAEADANLTTGALAASYNGRLQLTNVNGLATDHRTYSDGGTIKTDGAVVHTGGGISWKWTFSDTTRNIDYPLDITIARILVEANKTITISAWVRRNNTTDVGIRLRLRRYQLPGMSETDVLATCTDASGGAWEQLTLASFVPTQTGVVEVVAEGYYLASAAGNAWVDDIEVTSV